MEKVWKFRLNTPGDVTAHSVRMPKGAQILTLQVQDDEPTIWARVTVPTRIDQGKDGQYEEFETRRFHTFGTGWPLPFLHGADLIYVGTYQSEGWLVWHVFEEVL